MANSSFEKINYSIRPNKSIERKMFCEALTRLSFIDHLNKYRYIGFGSPYFADFILFHKNLGITNLVSIEKEKDKKDRFDFNIPYSTIQMYYGESTTVLPNLELDKYRNIVWLDYDDKISDFMFSDTDTFFSNAKAGSVFIISLNIEQEPNYTGDDAVLKVMSPREYRMSMLVDRIGKARIPSTHENVNLTTKNTGLLVYEMLNRHIQTTLIRRNGADGKLKFRQIFNFKYKDNATILTIGGILYDEAQEKQIKKMEFEGLPFIKDGEESYNIQCPNLTFREIKALDKILPDELEFVKGKFTNIKLQGIPLIPSDITNYAKIYRYYPNFADVNL
jgi:hypothetical protein